MSKIMDHDSHFDDLSRQFENGRTDADRSHQESRSDISAFSKGVEANLDKVVASSVSVSAEFTNVSAILGAARSSIDTVSKDLSNVLTSLKGLRETAWQAKRFLCIFPAEIRALIQSIVRSNTQMYMLLLKIHNSITTSPSDQGSSKIKLEDALGVVRELPYEWFRHWEVCNSYPVEHWEPTNPLASLSRDFSKHNSKILREDGKSSKAIIRSSTKEDLESPSTRKIGLSQ